MSRDLGDYWTLVVVNFLWASATAGPMSVLSLILRDNAVDAHSIGIIMSAATFAMALGTLLSGWGVSRIGALRVVVLSICCTSIALVSFEWATSYPLLAVLSRLLQGLGFGLFIPAGTMYVKSKAPNDQQIYYVGLFSAMAIAPYFFAQFLAEFYLRMWGAKGIFAIGALPFLLALILAIRLLPRELPVQPPTQNGSYSAVFRNTNLTIPYLCIFVVGLFFGFGASFLPIMMADAHVLIGSYFTPFAIVALASRFLLLRKLQRLPAPLLLSLGLCAIGLSGLWPIASLGAFSFALSGLLYGLGYSIAYPTSVEYVSQRFAPSERARPVALVNTFFQIGSIVSPILASYALGTTGLPMFFGLLGAAAIMAAVTLVASLWRPRPASAA